MVNAHDVRRQLRRIGVDYHFWGVAELRELPHILFENETIHHITNGRYSGGFATLCATDIRVLLIDKKPLFLTMEDIRYDMVSDVLFNHRLLNASIILGTVHKSITFIGFNKARLRQMTNFIQERVMAYRKHQAFQQTAQPEMQPAQFMPAAEPFGLQPTADPTFEPISYPAQPVEAQVAVQPTEDYQPPINPYKMPYTFRRRTTKFYR